MKAGNRTKLYKYTAQFVA